MFIQIGYEIAFELSQSTPMLYLLRVHPSREDSLLKPERFRIQHYAPGDDSMSAPKPLATQQYIDAFGNHAGRVTPPAGKIVFRNDAIVEDSGKVDVQAPRAKQLPVEALPPDVLPFLLPSRYCEVDSELANWAGETFQKVKPGWARVQAIVDFAHEHIKFDYMQANAQRTAVDVFRGKIGVCRDYTHLAVTLCRCMNIPARYCTGYLGDIGIPPVDEPMDFSAWFEAYLDGQWYAFDPRNHKPRIGRILVARGRDAADVAITTSFGVAKLNTFKVVTDEIKELAQDAPRNGRKRPATVRRLAGSIAS